MEMLADTAQAVDWVLDKLAAARRTSTPVIGPVKTVEQKKQELAAKKPKELELWQTWKVGGMKPKDLDPLLKSFSNLINSRVGLFKNRVEIPTTAIEHVHKKEFVNALKTYDPSRGAALGTHVMNRLQKAGRYIEQNKNFAVIPENISKYIGSFNAVKSELREKLGYEPGDSEIHDHILATNHPKLGGLALRDIKRINKEQRKGLIQTGHETDLINTNEMDPREQEVAQLIYHQLTPLERSVHEYTLGLNGKPVLRPGAIAKKLGIDGSKVSKVKKAVFEKMRPYLDT
jgi:DNA-directed RNA polymerase specialized sigma subunit